ncbi:AraC family transcriptional regulator [Nocardioides sp. Root1257]|uniref:helix-turn-helix domain-containing protein n=1 Tax=unclassified Nocardioides TaxID=2615069 RepID=UPI0007001D30|nr:MULTISPECIES: helix-turn-helix domain-containing protein [unclassified Nocardioides]KQW49008.1 AraC family transcriptional regulator [Nocardioides sp. Root1257]KRC48182.1 AraC family transcriptional regulator [Nocardioides sp. Root224]
MTARDRLRELLDAVLDEEHRSLDDMAQGAFSSPYHFARQLSAGAGEPPVAMRRRVMLERAAWQLRRGSSVTDVAFGAGYDSVEGFSRAFAKAYGHPPSQLAEQDAGSHWLPAPNGIHFHPPMSLWVHTGEQTMTQPLDLLVHHDLDDTRDLLVLAKQLSDDAYRRELPGGSRVHSWEGEEASVAAVLTSLVFTKEVWLAAVLGEEFPAARSDDVGSLLDRHDDAAARWLEMVRDIERRRAWDDRIVDALCEPPESFVLGSIVAHVLTYDAHRRLGVRAMLREHGVEVDEGDPINWLRRTETA